MIHVVDYGLGNVGAFLTLYKRLNLPAMRARTADELRDADHILLPGVGAFDHAMDLLNASGMRETMDELVLQRGVPVLGICVGMQILCDKSEEGIGSGLGWIPGTVRSLADRPGPSVPLPHMGWNDVFAANEVGLLRDIEAPRFYFLHNFYFDNAKVEDGAARADYAGEFTCMVNRGNIWGVQFHPEKSHHFGQKLLRNFSEL